MTAGKLDLYYGAQHYRLSGPTFWTAFPGPHIRFHLCDGLKSWDHRYVAFQGPLAGRWVAQGIYFDKPQAAPRGVEHAREFDLMLSLMFKPDALSQHRARNLLEGILLELAQARQAGSELKDDGWLKTTLDGLAGSDEPDYESLAKSVGMSLSTLRRRFKQVQGVPLHGYIVQSKILRARELLAETDEPIKSIADRLGYRDVYFFTRQFSQKVGVSPSAYRRSRTG
jgi:AraC-like DNA-binding protein